MILPWTSCRRSWSSNPSEQTKWSLQFNLTSLAPWDRSSSLRQHSILPNATKMRHLSLLWSLCYRLVVTPLLTLSSLRRRWAWGRDTNRYLLDKVRERKRRSWLEMRQWKEAGFCCRIAIWLFRGWTSWREFVSSFMMVCMLTLDYGSHPCPHPPSQSPFSKTVSKWHYNLLKDSETTSFEHTPILMLDNSKTAPNPNPSRNFFLGSVCSMLLSRIEGSLAQSDGILLMSLPMRIWWCVGDSWRCCWMSTSRSLIRCWTIWDRKLIMEEGSLMIRMWDWSQQFSRDTSILVH